MKFLDITRRKLHMTVRGGWSYLLLIPWFVPMVSYLLIGEKYATDGVVFVTGTLFVWFLSTVAFVTHDWVADAIARRFPGLGQTFVRAGLTAIAFIALSGVFLLFDTWLFIRFHLFGSHLTYDNVISVYGFDLIAIFLLVGIYETAYSLGQWQQHQVNKERLKRENLQGQLQGLKSQVNPHFLFNSLNSLSSLIADEPERAEQFVEEMARVYRYMLQANRVSPDQDDELTTLELELLFMDSYFHLLKTRYGAGIYLDTNVPEPLRQHRLPPLTLQLLVENAVKHNVILPTRPLQIEIFATEEGNLVVRNNLQRKATRPGDSTRVGLANIQAKYQLIHTREPVIETGPDYFTVILPLLSR